MKAIDPLIHTKIGIATTYGKPYFKFVKALKTLNLQFDSLLPEQITTYDGSLVLTTTKESPQSFNKPLLHEEICDKDPTVIRGLLVKELDLGLEKDELVIGIDPGQRIGLSVFYYGKEIDSSIFTSVDELVLHVVNILAELKSKRKIVKVGNGNMGIARKITEMLNLKFCSHFELEFVDERKTSLKIKNQNQRGKRDMMSARYITQREGYRHHILPLS